MRCLKILITGLLCLHFFAAGAQSRELKKKISMRVEAATLAQLLEQIQEQYQLHFSYVNNELPADTIRHFVVEEMPLFRVLDSLLNNAGTGYLQHGDQIIINKTFRKKAPAEQIKADRAEESHLAPPKAVETPGGASIPQEEASLTRNFLPQELSQEQVIQQAQKEVEMMPERKEALHNTPLTLSQEQAPRPAPATTFVAPTEKQDARKKQKPANRAKKESRRKKKRQERKEKEERRSDAPVQPLHLGLFYPISNHGTRAPLYANRFSAHALVGVAAGLEGWEFSGLGNIEKDYVEGYQFAGLFNVVGNEVKGMQFAGLLNTAGTNMSGGQFAGLFNYAGGEAKGIQASGLFNINRKIFMGSQMAGFMNLSAGDVRGFQAAGFMNRARNVNGGQVAGFMNLGDSVQGAQIAGFANKARKIKGLQAAGFINIASHVQGTQIGIINISDSLEAGIPIGIFSFVKNGYKGLEVYAAEDFHANINFKTGLRKFYNIFAVGLEVGERQSWGFGYGLGSEWKMGKAFALNTDIINYYVVEEGYRNFWNELPEGRAQVNLYKFRLLGTLLLSKRFALFGGPTYNFLLSQYKASAVNPTGSKLVQNVLYDRTTEDNNFKMWIGFNAGIRF